MKTNHYAQWNNIAIFITKPHENRSEQKHKQINRKLRGHKGCTIHTLTNYYGSGIWTWMMFYWVTKRTLEMLPISSVYSYLRGHHCSRFLQPLAIVAVESGETLHYNHPSLPIYNSCSYISQSSVSHPCIRSWTSRVFVCQKATNFPGDSIYVYKVEQPQLAADLKDMRGTAQHLDTLQDRFDGSQGD